MTDKSGTVATTPPWLIVSMSLKLAIPWRVALQQSSPPLRQPPEILNQKLYFENENLLNRKCG